jgi:hypothetical protein
MPYSANRERFPDARRPHDLAAMAAGRPETLRVESRASGSLALGVLYLLAGGAMLAGSLLQERAAPVRLLSLSLHAGERPRLFRFRGAGYQGGRQDTTEGGTMREGGEARENGVSSIFEEKNELTPFSRGKK